MRLNIGRPFSHGALSLELKKRTIAVSEFPRKGLASNRFSGERIQVEFGGGIELPFPSRAVEWLMATRPYHSTVHRFESESSVDITADAVPELNRFSPVT